MSELRDSPGPCDDCECLEGVWDGRNYVLRTDPPQACECGHSFSRHTYLGQ